MQRVAAPGTAPAAAPDPFSRGACAQCRASCGDRAEPGAHGLGAPGQVRVRSRPRTLPAVRGRYEDHRRHRGACGDCEDIHALGNAGESAAALTGTAAGALPGSLILKARTALQRGRRFRAACARAWRSERVEIGPHGSTQRPTNPREGDFHKTPCKLIASRPGDTVAHGQKGGGEFPSMHATRPASGTAPEPTDAGCRQGLRRTADRRLDAHLTNRIRHSG